MSLRFIRNDITKMRTDAIVLPANNELAMGPGASESIFRAAGMQKLEGTLRVLYPEGCEMGKAVVTHGFDLPAKWIIHAVCPQWLGGKYKEDEFLYSAYREALLLAREKKCGSIAFPLLSAGSYMYPRMQAIYIAVKAIMDFLAENEMEVILVLFTRDAVRDVEKLFGPVESYLDDGYTEETERGYRRRDRILDGRLQSDWYNLKEDYRKLLQQPTKSAPVSKIMQEERESFHDMLFRKVREKGMTDPEVYQAANLTKQTYHKIKSKPDAVPKKKTILALAIGLHLTIRETNTLLMKAGYALSDYFLFDRIIKYFLDTQDYDFDHINNMLDFWELKDEQFRILEKSG